MKKTITFDDVLIVPQFTTISSRESVDTTSNIFDVTVDLPIISANMTTVTGVDVAKYLTNNNMFACIPRFMSVEDNNDFLKQIDIKKYVVQSVGLDDWDRAEMTHDRGINIICLDVANAACQKAVEFTKMFKQKYPETHLIVGNFGSVDSLEKFLFKLESNELPSAIKAGVGSGAGCETRTVAGIGYPQLSLIQEVSYMLSLFPRYANIKVISDGGCKTSGDINKALKYANLVMLGRMIAGVDESPFYDYATDENMNPTKRYVYSGSASKESYEQQGKVSSFRAPEGATGYVTHQGSLESVINNINGGIRSGMSYVDARNLIEFKSKIHFIEVSPGTALETKTRI